MEKKITKLLDNKYENLVQFNVVNTTSNPIYLDLFNTADLSTIPSFPTYIYPPNSVSNTITTPISATWSVLNSIGYLYVSDGTSLVYVYDVNNNNVLITTISVGLNNASFLLYNPSNNLIYASDNINSVLLVIDCSTNTYISQISVPFPSSMVLNTQDNTIYITSNTGLHVVDCATFSLTTTILLNCNDLTYNSTQNLVYTTISSSNDVTIVDCSLNAIIGTITLLNPYLLTYNVNNNYLYVANNAQTEIAIIDCSTNTLLNSITTNPLSGLLSFPVLDIYENNIYWGTTLGRCIQFDTVNNVIINDFYIGASAVGNGTYDNSNNFLFFPMPFLNSVYQITTLGITTTSYYISGSSNYNAFVNNLNNEPIQIQMIRLFVQNQEQLYNQLQLTKIDSSGNQIFLPDFPINQVDIMQQQGNIGEISLNNVVFDGRTYINQYQLNANESISFEIYYTQLDLTSVTPTLPIFFKPKIQLKEYIKKEFNL